MIQSARVPACASRDRAIRRRCLRFCARILHGRAGIRLAAAARTSRTCAGLGTAAGSRSALAAASCGRAPARRADAGRAGWGLWFAGPAERRLEIGPRTRPQWRQTQQRRERDESEETGAAMTQETFLA